MNRIILASASPRRSELLRQIGLEFRVIPSSCEEIITSTSPQKVVEELSAQKAMDVYGRIEDKTDCIVVGADTVVAFDGQILGKPRSAGEAVRTLSMLQGNTHQVYTGVSICCERKGRTELKTFHECTQVTFCPMTQEEIEDYVRSGEPMDKAGSYGIQGRGAVFVSEIKGDYSNVVGLPLARLYREMKNI